ncbi:MAG: hypothetical protein A2017_01840 [Lentisphaerae bacterium GWF2_44_16]|nr:MAG: hypothetical protein A2017_01840 [Lentisphaerae bacterium GWF2_44_16]
MDENGKAMDKAMRLLSSRAHSRRELGRKLYQRGFSSGTISFVIAECERLGFLNDEDFASDYAEELRNKGYGAGKVRNSLAQKGIDRGIIDEEIAGTEKDDEYSRAETALEKKLRTLKNEKDIRKRKEKAYRFLISRGFSGEIVSELLRKETI